MDDFVRNIAIESWTLYTVGIMLIACRIISRRIKLGSLRNLQLEDWLMVVASFFFTGFAVAVNEVAKNGSNYMDPEVAAALTPDEVATAVYGSKMVLVMEMCTLTTVWLVKACLLLLYYRLTKAAYFKQMLAVKAIAAFCIIGYLLVVTLCLAYWCRPIEEYWRVPVAQSECATYYNHMKFATSFNVSSDLMLLLIPLPIILRTSLPLKRKLVLCFVLGLGVFNIIAAVLNRYYNFSNPNDLGYTYWYVGEVSISIFVGNIPLCWPLIRRVFRANTWSDSGDLGQAPPLPRKPPRAKPRLYSTGWPSTWGQTAWDKMDEAEVVVQTKGVRDTETGDESAIPSHGSEIELTPTWHRQANQTGVGSGTVGARESSEDSPLEDTVKEGGRGVVVVKTIQIRRE